MDDITDPIWRTGAVRAALDSGDPGAIVRSVRKAHQITLAELAAHCGYSPSTISRLETGRQPLRDVQVLRSLAAALAIPAHLLGLADTPVRTASILRPAAKVTSILRPDEEIDPMRRRTLLAGLAGSAVFDAQSAPAGFNSLGELEAVLFEAPTADPAPAAVARLGREVTAVRTLFQQGRYPAIASTLPRLLSTAESARAQMPGGSTEGQTAELYTVATELLAKRGDDQLAWITADRAMQAAYASGDVLIQATARRAWGIVLRRAGRADTANQLVIDAAAALQPGLHHGPVHMSVYGSLLSTAAYTAAVSGDRDTAHTLITEADEAARRIGIDANHQRTVFAPTGVDLYRISIARALGDPGTAIDIARRVNPAAIATVERRGQYWTDVARSFDQWGKPEQCYRALLAAEQAAPDEVRYRGRIQQITQRLLSRPTVAAMPGLRAFAIRVGAA